jgi:hypothetical protein
MSVRWSRMSWSDRNELWARWRRGESVRQIALGLRRASSVIHTVVAAEGGITPRPRRRSRLALSSAEREEISRHLACGHSLRAISQMLGRAPSTLSREVAHHGGRSVYRAAVADKQAWQRTRRPQHCRRSTHPALRRIVAHKLAQQWSPQQISGFDAPFRVMLTCRCHRKRSTAACSCKVAASCAAVFSNTCGASIPFDTRAPALGCTRDRARFSTPFRFESDRQKSVPVLSLGIGKAISLKAREARSSRRASSVNRATCCWCDYRARIRTPSLAPSPGGSDGCHSGSSSR